MASTTTYSRYHVCDPTCGYVDGYSRKTDAMQAAITHQARHDDDKETVKVTVYDLMARHDAMQEWNADGRCIAWKQ